MELKDKIQEQFRNNPSLRILFYFDNGQEHKEEIAKWSDAEILCYISDGRNVNLKYKLEKEFQERKVFLYFPFPEPSDKEKEEFPLLDLLIANKQLYIDPIRSFIEEHGLVEIHKNIIERYYASDLRFKNRKEFLSSILSHSTFSYSRLKRGLICFHLGLSRVMDPNLCVAKLMVLSLDEVAFNETIKKLKDLDLIDDVLHWIDEIFGIHEKELTAGLMKHLANIFKYNLITRTIENTNEEDQYLKLRLDTLQMSRQWGFYLDWDSENSLKSSIDKVMYKLAHQINEEKIIEWYGLDASYGYWTPILKDKILAQCIEGIRFQPFKIKERIKNWYDQLENEKPAYKSLLCYIWNACSMFEMLKGEPTFRYNHPEDYLKQYVNEYCLIDLYYRKASTTYEEVMKFSFPDDFPLETSINQLNDAYETQFVSKFNYEWMQCLKENGFDFNAIPVSKQYTFYRDQIYGADQRIAVIISDAFRYEIAVELIDLLSNDSKNTGKLSWMLASVPSDTSLGMANLLPNQGIDSDGKGYSIKGLSTEGLENRSKILSSNNPTSTAISFQKLISMTQQEGRDFFKQFEVVYIYHNKIDAIGDSLKSEMAVFSAVAKTLEDIQVMLKKLNNWNVYKTLVTADHGFLMSMRKIGETMKEDLPEVKGEFKIHNRCVVAEEITDTHGGYRFELAKSSAVKSNLKVMVPRSVNRFKRQGSGDQYVHSGASIQELVIPVMLYTRKRTDESTPVTVRLIRFDQRITSGYLKADILQIEPLGPLLKERTLNIGLYSSAGEILSQVERIVLNATSGNPTERTFRIMLNLGSQGTKETTCLLKGYDEGDPLNSLFEERIIIQTLIEKDEF